MYHNVTKIYRRDISKADLTIHEHQSRELRGSVHHINLVPDVGPVESILHVTLSSHNPKGAFGEGSHADIRTYHQTDCPIHGGGHSFRPSEMAANLDSSPGH